MATFDLSRHPAFTPWTDPVSGVTSYLLTQRVADQQLGFYFVNPSISRDGEHLWFYAGNYPTPVKCLGVVSLNPATPTVRLLPRTTFQSESPLVDAAGRGALFTSGQDVWHTTAEGECRRVVSLPREFVAGRRIIRLATHLSRSADGRWLLLDGEIGNTWFAAVGSPTTGEFRLLCEFPRQMNHGQFSPTDPDLFSLAQDWYHDAATGRRFPFTHRLWLLGVDSGRYECLQPLARFAGDTRICHEWWAPDGTFCWIHYEEGIFEHDLATKCTTQVYAGAVCHAHTDRTRQWWVWDESPYKWDKRPCEVMFYHRGTGKKVAIASALPMPPVPRHPLHIDPHPHFSGDGQWIIYTTTVRGAVDVALVRVEDLVARTT